MSATPIEISVGGSRTATEWDGCSITWADFTDDLQNAMQNNCGTETHAEYMALSKGKQASWAAPCGVGAASAAAAPGAA